MKYFYSDVTAAMYMAVNHDMKFIMDGLHEVELWSPSILENGYFDDEARYYIHPDSYELLKPREGDLISINGGESASLIIHPDMGKVLEANASRFVAPVSIIQRLGKPFIWPEVEDA